MKFTGKNTDFTATWDCYFQTYIVYYKGQELIKKFRFSDIESYLN